MRFTLLVLAAATTSASAQSAAPQSTVIAPEDSLPLGAQCSSDSQCGGDAQCWASNSMLIRRCGNFNAACSSNLQCAYNLCNNGLCNGIIAPSGNATATAYLTSGSPASTPYGTAPSNSYTSSAPGATSTAPSTYTGDATPMSAVLSGAAALVFGVIAWVV